VLVVASEKEWFNVARRLLSSSTSSSLLSTLRLRLRHHVLTKRCLGNSLKFAARMEKAAQSILELDRLSLAPDVAPTAGLIKARRNHIFFPSSLCNCGSG
jgi:hypothetical protein